jgi:adenosine kinase
VHKDQPTGCCGVLIKDNKRCLLPLLGAATQYPTEHLKKEWKAIENSKLLYTTAYFISTNNEALMMIARHALAENKMFIFNLAATFWIEKYFKEINELIPYCDVIIGNGEEASILSKMKGYGTDDKMEIMKKMLVEEKKNSKRTRTVIITQGHQETVAGTYDFDTKKIETFTLSPTKIDQKDIVDTNGAGDSFAGGLLVGLALGKDLKTCLTYANYLGWECIQQIGCTFPPQCKMNLS